ncbi:hypothetical protein T01_13766 [Trichinella spiralis]|uniref:Uncharacterized protein n=1 Tax=Trichinella spiralis TaxID=6334 RepID=A0A0V1BFV1_TRISP|nr:hypothetical protein T01_13766 [Trichinella spiralis]
MIASIEKFLHHHEHNKQEAHFHLISVSLSLLRFEILRTGKVNRLNMIWFSVARLIPHASQLALPVFFIELRATNPQAVSETLTEHPYWLEIT